MSAYKFRIGRLQQLSFGGSGGAPSPPAPLTYLGHVFARPTGTQSMTADVAQLMIFPSVLEDTLGIFTTPFQEAIAPTGAQYAQVTAYRDVYNYPEFVKQSITQNGTEVYVSGRHNPHLGIGMSNGMLKVEAGDAIGFSVRLSVGGNMEISGYFGVTFYA